MRAQPYLAAAAAATDLIRQPIVGERWTDPSALPGFTVGGLAEHLAGQVFSVAAELTREPSTQELVPLLEHYARAAWVGADRDAEVNVAIRGHGERLAGEGPVELVTRLDGALGRLAGGLPGLDPERPVQPPAGPWSLTLDDFLVTRMMEIAVHLDDLACSVDVPTPELPGDVLDPVLGLLVGLSLRRHGATGVLRALSRAERAPVSIAAF